MKLTVVPAVMVSAWWVKSVCPIVTSGVVYSSPPLPPVPLPQPVIASARIRRRGTTRTTAFFMLCQVPFNQPLDAGVTIAPARQSNERFAAPLPRAIARRVRVHWPAHSHATITKGAEAGNTGRFFCHRHESAGASTAGLRSQHGYAALALGVCDLIVMGQPVANTGHGEDIPRRAGVRLDLLAQPPHVDPQKVRRVVIGWPPHPFEQFLM